MGFTNFKLGAEGRSVGSPYICVDDVVAAIAASIMDLSLPRFVDMAKKY